jgi:hypothetical protein
MIRGSVDIITIKLVTGWLYSDEHQEPLSVDAVINGEVVGRAVAKLPRPDLAAAGLGNGKCGFEVRFANEIDALYLPFVQIMVATTDLELRRYAAAGFRDYFRALYQRYPRAGRSASVFGGLWIDRTDAAAMLKGRTDIGLIAPSDANAVARLIQDGIIVVDCDVERALQTVAKPLNNDLAASVGRTLFDDNVLKVMRAVLDDHPVAVRADVVDSDDGEFMQMSAAEDLPSPAECLGLVFPDGEHAISVDVVRGGHRFPEFLPNGTSRWTHAGAQSTARATLAPDLPVDRHLVPPGSAIVIGPGALFRVRATNGNAIRVLALPARLTLMRFHQKAPSGELTHESGARVWIQQSPEERQKTA